LAELDAETRARREVHPPVADLGLGTDELAADRRVPEQGRQELERRRVDRCRVEVASGSGRDAALPPVRDHRRGVEGGELCDSPDLRQTAAPVDVRLENVDSALRQPLATLEAGGGELGAADA